MFADLYIYFGVALAGLASFLSPCVLPLVPPYLGYLGGTTIDQMSSEKGLENAVWRRVVIASLFFVLGFTTVFVGLGAGASLFGQLIQEHKALLSLVAGGVILLFGLHFLGLLPISLLYSEARYHAEMQGASFLGAYLIGLAFAFGWTPCVGPILATVLALAANEGSLGTGVSLLLAYSLGLGIPFVLAAVAIRPFLSFMQRFKRHLGAVEKVMGVTLVLMGLLLLGEVLGIGRSAILEAVPALRGYTGLVTLFLLAIGLVLLFRPGRSLQWSGLAGIVVAMTFLGGSMNDLGQWMLETFPALAEVEAWATPDSLQTDIMRKGLDN